MASLRSGAEQQVHRVDSEGVDPGPTVADQLIEQTVSLTISGQETEADGLAVPGRDTTRQLETTHSPVQQLCPGVWPYADTMTWEQAQNVAGRSAARILNSRHAPSMAEPPSRAELEDSKAASSTARGARQSITSEQLEGLPNEVLFHILSYLEVCDLLATSRVR
ncbi:hypothetical protein BT67DRAFT_291377 [Trichocladium antarcticum]|uniref:F-box domain-containing protein n=1 Tax=Trichocladium antarcticum TaxID=1450529 RepID=A0AAN6ZE84_9PEZI|nr:hypothetical protein BT67DRAFT_291377 [Trichocladium antarcticum]